MSCWPERSGFWVAWALTPPPLPSHILDKKFRPRPDLVLLLPVEVPDELLEAALALSDEEADPDPAMTLGLLAEIHKTSVIC